MKRKALAFITCIVTAITILSAFPTKLDRVNAAGSEIIGDVNGDSVIDVFDVAAAKHGTINGFTDSAIKKCADIDGNGNVTNADIKSLQDYVLGKIDKFPPRQQGGMRDMTSQQIVGEMGLGWNLGNTLDSCGDWLERGSDGTVEGRNETAWGNPKATEALMKTVKSYGFDSIRIPVTWYENADKNGNITKLYMDRVQQVVDWALDADLYVVLNMHHEGWLGEAQNNYNAVSAQYKSYWTQIGTRFKNYPDKLIFEAMNEVGFGYDTWNGSYAQNSLAYETMTKMSQLFVDTIRGQGGNNAGRHLLVAGIWTGLDDSIDPRFKMPVDPANRLIISMHCYSPSTFCIAEEPDNSWGYRYDWGTPADLAEMADYMNKLKTHFIDKGIPVIVGEYAVCGVKKDHASKILWTDAVARSCLKIGACPMYWDAGGDIDRERFTFRDDDLARVFLNIAGKTKQDSFTVTAKIMNDIKATGNVPLDGYTVDLSAFKGKQIVEVKYTLKGNLGKDGDGWTYGGGGYDFNGKTGDFNYGGFPGMGSIELNSESGGSLKFMLWWGTYANASDVFVDTVTVCTWETVTLGGKDYRI